MFAIAYYIKLLRLRLLKKYSFTIYPSMKMLENRGHGADSDLWTDALFDKMFRFRREHFFRVLDAMHLRDKSLLCSNKGHEFHCPADICLMVVL